MGKKPYAFFFVTHAYDEEVDIAPEVEFTKATGARINCFLFCSFLFLFVLFFFNGKHDR